jgi:hypothetical protein
MELSEMCRDAPSKSPIAKSPAIISPKTGRACFVATRRLSARQPSVFGVSRCSRKLAASHTTKTTHVPRALYCRRQMNKRMNAGSSVTSASENQRFRAGLISCSSD